MQFTACVTNGTLPTETAPPQRLAGGLFAPGNKLGASGRPKGVDARAEFIKAQGADAPAKAVVEVLLAMIAKAIGGDVQAARVVLERLAGPVRQEVDMTVDQPPLDDETAGKRLLAILTLAMAKKQQERN